MPEKPFRVKLVMPSGPDAHYWYADTLQEAYQLRGTLHRELPPEVEFRVYIYVETSLGHVRVA